MIGSGIRLSIVLLTLFVASILTSVSASAQQSPVTAIDILLNPDQSMLQRANDANARLLKSFPKGFALDAAHTPHITMLQRYVQTADLDKIYVAVGNVLASEQVTNWKLRAFKYYYIPSGEIGLAGIVIEPTDDLVRLQQKLIDAVAPFAGQNGTAAAFFSTEEGRDIQPSLVEYAGRLCTEIKRQEFQPSRHHWRRNSKIPE